MYGDFWKFTYFCFQNDEKMLSKNKLKLIRSLEMRKYREANGLFVAEGNKLVAELLPVFECELLIAQPAWLARQGEIAAHELQAVEEEEIRRASFLKNPQEVLALFRLPKWELSEAHPERQLTIALDGVQDPGNLGTIARLADWFGIGHIVCSKDTADLFSPKAVQATMGALARTQIHYTDLAAYLTEQKRQGVPLYGTLLDGENIYGKALSNRGILVMGNEGNGIRPAIEALIDERLYIPSYPAGRPTSESLNVAIATAIACAEFRRRAGDAE